MGEDVAVVRVRELPDEIDVLVREAADEGFRFVERLRDDWSLGVNRFDEPGEALFVACRGKALAGVCGLNRDPYVSDAACGRLRRLYVRPAMRRMGVARALTDSALAAARGCFEVVRLRTFDLDAASFYRVLGFSVVESNSHATHERRISSG